MEYFQQQALVISAKEVLPRMRRTAKQSWIKQKILDRMEERRKAKLMDMDLYRKLNKEVRKMCKQVGEKWFNKQCDEIKVNPRNIHQKIKYIVYKKKIASGHCVKAKNGSVLIDQKNIQDIWDEYIEELYNDNLT